MRGEREDVFVVKDVCIQFNASFQVSDECCWDKSRSRKRQFSFLSLSLRQSHVKRLLMIFHHQQLHSPFTVRMATYEWLRKKQEEKRQIFLSKHWECVSRGIANCRLQICLSKDKVSHEMCPLRVYTLCDIIILKSAYSSGFSVK